MTGYLKHTLMVAWLFLKDIAGEFVARGCQKSAAALTYMTLFALVPLMTVAYFMFSMIPVFDGVSDQLQYFIFNNFVPDAGKEVQDYLADFSSQARSLTGFGVGFLLVTAYLMLTNIEKTFNTIWGVKRQRRGLFGFLLYWAVLSIGPLLLGVGLMASTYLLSVKLVVNELDLFSVLSPLVKAGQWLTASAAFTLLFAAVPNCKVPLRFAVIGGVVTGVCFEVLKAAFGYFVSNTSFQLIYGAFAIVPLFLLWVNFLWMIILAGAVLVRTLTDRGYGRSSEKMSDLSAALVCLSLFRDSAKEGKYVSDTMCVASGVGIVHWQKIREVLVEHRWVAVTEGGDYVLSRNLSDVSLWRLAQIVKFPLDQIGEQEEQRSEEWYGKYVNLQSEVGGHIQQKLGVSIDSLLESGCVERQN